MYHTVGSVYCVPVYTVAFSYVHRIYQACSTVSVGLHYCRRTSVPSYPAHTRCVVYSSRVSHTLLDVSSPLSHSFSSVSITPPSTLSHCSTVSANVFESSRRLQPCKPAVCIPESLLLGCRTSVCNSFHSFSQRSASLHPVSTVYRSSVVCTYGSRVVCHHMLACSEMCTGCCRSTASSHRLYWNVLRSAFVNAYIYLYLLITCASASPLLSTPTLILISTLPSSSSVPPPFVSHGRIP
uniref:Uncharacterized protein n=1 Tax=Lygus hesperus TaxID=30085 RepID=A0A146MHG0_LYGHE